MVNWEFESNALERSGVVEHYERTFWMGRLGVAYVEEIDKYAMFVQHNDGVLIVLSSTPAGPFKVHNRLDMTERIGTPNTGDQTVFTDPDTGKSYLVYSYGQGRNKIYVSEIGVKDDKVTLLDVTQVFRGKGREGNCNESTGEWTVADDNNYVKNASFEAGRKAIPSPVKAIQEQLHGWYCKVEQGNVIVIESEDSPVLNYFNTTDRKHVIGEKSLNIADSIEFKRKVFQIIESSPYVKLKDGSYKLTAKVKHKENFDKLEMYAESAGKKTTTQIQAPEDTWVTIEIDDVKVSNDKVEIGFFAHGAAESSCQVDDVSLVQN